MIEIVLGNIGSGKTASIVREIVLNSDAKVTFSNIETPKLKNNILITPEMIVKKEFDDKGKLISKKLNVEFWQEAVKKYGGINVVLDEAHSLFNSRRAMSSQNIIMSDFLALLRRVIGGDSISGKLVLITQLERRLDPIAREMATKVKFHMCHYTITCSKCRMEYGEHNETAEKLTHCLKCNSTRLSKKDFILEVWHFQSMDLFHRWKEFNIKTFHKHYLITDIEDYFSYYNTLQWSNLISTL